MLNLQSLREQVYQYLRGEMHRGNLLPGSTINIAELSAKLGISKTPLRDALIYLEAEGFVTILPRRGVVVNKLTLQDIQNSLVIVGALEGAAIIAAYPSITAKTVSRLEGLNQKMRKAVSREDFESYYHLNTEFHDVFLKLAGNEALRQLVVPLKLRLYEFPRPAYIKEWELINCDEHAQIIEQLKCENPQGAAGVMRDAHWSFSKHEKFIRKFYFDANREIEAELDRLRNGGARR